jgi:hypothetical protein
MECLRSISLGRLGRRTHDEGETLALHWNGVRWRHVPTPVEGSFSQLFGVSAIASNDVWAVGSFGAASALILHWDGATWTDVPSPALTDGFRTLFSVTAIAADDVWAAGSQGRAGATSRTLVEHWDGQRWRVIPTPNVAGADNYLWDIDAGSAGDIWAVGEEEGDDRLPITEHWDGTGWSILPGPDLGGAWGVLRSVVSISPTDVLAVGYGIDTFFFRSSALVVEWDGTTWETVSAESPGVETTALNAVTEASPTEAWSVLIVLPILNIYRKYYGARVSLFLLGTFYPTMVAAGLVVEVVFDALGLIPFGPRHAKVVEASLQLNYTTVLNVLFLALAAVLVLRFLRTGGLGMLRMMDAPMERAAATGGGPYSCPMHPEVVSDLPGSCPKCGMALRPTRQQPEP